MMQFNNENFEFEYLQVHDQAQFFEKVGKYLQYLDLDILSVSGIQDKICTYLRQMFSWFSVCAQNTHFNTLYMRSKKPQLLQLHVRSSHQAHIIY